MFFAVEHLCHVLDANWLRKPSRDPGIRGVGIDSRDDLADKAFIAIKGSAHDGHQFLDLAVKSGAGLLIVETTAISISSSWPDHIGVMRVESARTALATLARAYRRTLQGTKVIAITGSAGKTTTKRLVHAALSNTMQGASSPKSFNNDIGVPLTILQAKSSDGFLVVEIGTNAPGEVAQLAAIAEPELAVITSIGRAHLQGLGSLEGIAAEKASLLEHLQSNGAAIVNADAPLLRPYLKRVKNTVLFGAADDADLRLTARGNGEDKRFDNTRHQEIKRTGSIPGCDEGLTPISWFEINGRDRFQLHLPGRHNAMNALAAVAVGRRLGMEDQAIALGLRSVEPAAMRLALHRIGEITVCNDAYNANPDSMMAAIDAFSEIAADAARRIFILGDMLELGVAGPELHREIGRHLLKINAQSRMDRAVLIGELSAFIAQEILREWPSDRVLHFGSIDRRAIDCIIELLQPGDAALMKASRGMELERLIPPLQQRLGSTRAAQHAIANARD